MRDLVVAYRLVPAERMDDYNREWMELRDLAEGLDLRAWRFRSLEAGDEFVEFLEGSVASAAETVSRLKPIRRNLDELAPAISDRLWEEAPVLEVDAPAANDRAELVSLFREKSLKLGRFVLASGERSDYYIDARPTTMSAAGQRLIGRLGRIAIDEQRWEPAAVGGLTLGADPAAYAIAHRSALLGRPIDAFTVRKEAKDHGTGRRIEGNFAAGMTVVIIEDVMTTGGSALEAARAVTEAGAHVLGVLAVVDRQAGGAAALAVEGYPLVALFNASELLED